MRFITWINETADNRILFYGRDKEQYGFLSNFHPSPFQLDGRVWPTVEHYYQAMKSESSDYQDVVMNAPTPGKAKRLGSDQAKQSLFRRGHQLRPDWDQVKLAIMERALQEKFKQNPHLAQMLKSTGTAELVEDSSTDTFWGSGADGSGLNYLGRLLMKIRSQI